MNVLDLYYLDLPGLSLLRTFQVCARGIVFVRLSVLINAPSAYIFPLCEWNVADNSGFGGFSFVELCMTFRIDLREQSFHAQIVSHLIC